MRLTDKDLNLLLVFSAIWEERNLSRAALRLFVSQSAVSHSLKRLRHEFKDDLFVRHSKGVVPTDVAKLLAPRVSHLLGQIDEMYSANQKFDPKEAKRDLVLAAGDYFSMTALERLVLNLAAKAPGVRLIVRPVANVFQLDTFERGEIHLAITAIDVTAKEGFYAKKLGQDKISICVRKDHPEVRRQISPEKYLKLKHVNVSNFGSTLGVADLHLETLKKKREVGLVTSSFFDAGRLLRSTDFVLSAPHQICLTLAREYGLAVFSFPFSNSRMRSVSMIWHERTHQDPFHAWVRKLISENRES